MPWLFQYKGKSEVWWLGYRMHGQQFLRSTGFRERDKAEQELERVKAMISAHKANALTRQLFQQLTGQSAPTITLKAALEEWITEAKGATGPRTWEKYERLQTMLLEVFKANDQGPMLADIRQQDLQRILTKRRETVSAGTVNMDRKAMAIFFKRAKRTGYLQDNPVEGIPLFKSSKSGRRAFTKVEVAELYRVAPDDFWKYMVLAGFFTGLRMGDLVTMPIGAVDFQQRQINIFTRKTGLTLHIPIAKPLYQMLVKLKNGVPASNPVSLFWPEHAARYEESGSGWFSQRFYDLLLVKAGLARVRPHRPGTKSKAEKRKVNETSFHCLRHSYVTTLAALGHNQQVVKALAGHSDDAVNDLYTHVPTEVLRDAVKKLPDITKEVSK